MNQVEVDSPYRRRLQGTSSQRPLLARFRSNSPRQFAIMLLCLLAFLVQSHVAQTHFHPGAQSGTYGAPHKQGGGENPASCALCQIVLHGGGAAPLPASAVAVALQILAFLAPDEQLSSGAVAAVSHSWQSRAPPIR